MKLTTNGRAHLSEVHHLPLRDARRPHPVDLTFWYDRRLIDVDANRTVLLLTDSGRERLAQMCETCGSWRPTQNDAGECWSPERIDDVSQGHAGVTMYYETCEAHCPRSGPAAMPEARR